MAPCLRTGALISLLLALNAVHEAVDPAAAGLSKREMNANAKRIAGGAGPPTLCFMPSSG